MNIIECKVDGLKQYEIEIWKADVSKHLCSLKQSDSDTYFDCSGLSNIKAFLTVSRRQSVTEEFRRILICFEKIIEAELAVSKYLISDRSISLKADEIWMNRNNEIVFQPHYCDMDFFSRLCSLADELKASELSKKLREKNAIAVMSERDILSFLSLWELELR